jgi:hypothetical protein
MYVLVREDETEQHKRDLKNSIEPQIHQLLNLADEYSAEQEKLEAQLKEQVCERPFYSLRGTLSVDTYHPSTALRRVTLVNVSYLLAHAGQKSKPTQREANRCATGGAFAAT